MKKRQTNWRTYWNHFDDLDYLLKADENIESVYEEIKTKIDRNLMPEEMFAIQESLENRIEKLQKAKTIAA